MNITDARIYETIKAYKGGDFDFLMMKELFEYYFEVFKTLKALYKRKNKLFYVERALEDKRLEVIDLLQHYLNKKFEYGCAENVLECYAKDHHIKY